MTKLLWFAITMCLLGTSSVSAFPFIYVADDSGRLGRVDVASGEAEVIGNMGGVMTDIAFSPGGDLYGVTESRLYRIDQQTAAIILIGYHGIEGTNALVFGVDGTLYIAGSDFRYLLTIDPATGSPIDEWWIGRLSSGDLAFYGDYLYLSGTNDLVKIDFGCSVTASDVGPLAYWGVYGLARGDDNVLYGVSGTTVFSVDAATASCSFVLNYAGHGLGQAFGAAFSAEAVPMPGACCQLDGACDVTIQTQCGSPGIWIGGTGGCDPNPCLLLDAGACCSTTGECTITLHADCLPPCSWHGDLTTCLPTPCPQPTDPWACCFPDGHCTVLTQSDCHWQGGTFYLGAPCSSFMCNQPVQACCFPDASCVLLHPMQCLASGGNSVGSEWQSCDPPPCPNSDAAETATVPFRSRVAPNPASATCRISYWVDTPGTATVEVVNAEGRMVRQLGSAFQGRGGHSQTWDGMDDAGNRVPSGVYFARVFGPHLKTTVRVVVLR